MCPIFNLGDGIAVIRSQERWVGVGGGGEVWGLCDLSCHSSGESSKSRLRGSCAFGSLQCSFCFSLAEEDKHAHSPTPRAPAFSLSAFLTFPPSKGIQRKMMGQGKPLSAGPWALPQGVAAWALHLSRGARAGEHKPGPGQASMTRLPTGRDQF